MLKTFLSFRKLEVRTLDFEALTDNTFLSFAFK